jgi:hypothetical protein
VDLPRTAEFEFLSSRRARIRVDESFGGLSPTVTEVEVLTGSGGGDCGILFKVGDAYLIDASVGKDGLIRAGICSSTRRIEYAGIALRILRQRRDGRQVPSLAGQIARQDRNFEGNIGTRIAKPLANVPVRVKAAGRVYETLADSEGFYEFHSLPSGQYEFAPDLPPGTRLSWFIGSDKPLQPFALNAGACQERNIEVFPSGSVQGRVLDASGKPLKEVFAYILPASQEVIPKKGELYWEFQGKEGFFKFVHIPPGEYVIAVNPDDSRDPNFPFRRTFYPGVHDRDSAKIITVRGGEQITDADILLEPEFATRRLTVRVTWADGRVIKDSVYLVAKGTANPAAMSHTSQPNRKASVINLSILPNEPYEIEGELICRYADERSMGPGAILKSNKIYLAPGDDRTELFLTMPASACPPVPGKTLLTEK